MSRFQMLSDAQWELIAPTLPTRTGRQGRPFADARMMVEAIIYRYRCGIPWRDLPEVYGPWQTVWTWQRRMAAEGTWDTVLAKLTAAADTQGLVDWRSRWTPRSPALTSTPRTPPGTQGAGSSYKNLREEPADSDGSGAPVVG